MKYLFTVRVPSYTVYITKQHYQEIFSVCSCQRLRLLLKVAHQTNMQMNILD